MNTQDDWWRMVWQENVTDIVMLTNVMEGVKVHVITIIALKLMIRMITILIRTIVVVMMTTAAMIMTTATMISTTMKLK